MGSSEIEDNPDREDGGRARDLKKASSGRKRRVRSDDDDSDKHRRQRKTRKENDEASNASSSPSEDSSEEERRRRRRKRRKERKRRERKDKKKKHRKRKSRREESDSSDNSSDDDRSGDSDNRRSRQSRKGNGRDSSNTRLIAKLQARGETLEERKQRRAAKAEQKRAAYISTKFGYTAEDNPFHDPNIHQTFTWKKKEEQGNQQTSEKTAKDPNDHTTTTLEEIEKLRQRRQQRELQQEEMERIRREESRMKELENFDEWAKKEEDFHLQQQRQRSAIRLVQGREKPIDILAKNMLLFGIDKDNRAAVKYKERYNAMEELENLEVELEEPHKLLHMLKLEELEEVLMDIDAFLTLEREAADTVAGTEGDSQNPILLYWQALKTVALDEIKFLKSGGDKGPHAKTGSEIQKIFQHGQSTTELEQMKVQVAEKLAVSQQEQQDPAFDREYWETVLEQLDVHLAKRQLTQVHSEMLVRQLERLEQERAEIARMTPEERQRRDAAGKHSNEPEEAKDRSKNIHEEDDEGFGGVKEENLTEEVNTQESAHKRTYAWADKYRPRKPRYFNRVKTGYDWNKYNKTHYDRDNPPPKTVQGYKFNIFYPDLIDQSKTPQFELLKADSPEFCIIRFSAGPPYEDIAFKILNREWNKSRKHGFKSTFERGILSLYFNFKTNWYRR
mmetsp:Transcript_3065/g.6544  ORF Transcript_3065/g.6544 Transcript_3065/m.6544 type:complete len:675 (-) Transcript_3065:232-2256(-)